MGLLSPCNGACVAEELNFNIVLIIPSLMNYKLNSPTWFLATVFGSVGRERGGGLQEGWGRETAPGGNL